MPWLLLWLACLDAVVEPPPPPDERDLLHAAELELLRAEALERLESGAIIEAGTPLVAAERLGGLPDLRARAWSMSEDEALVAQLSGAFADAIRSNPAQAGKHYQTWRRLGARAEIRERYASGPDAPLARVRGVDRALAQPVLALARAQHVSAPSEADVASVAADRIAALAKDAGAQAAFPGIEKLSPGSLDAVVEDAAKHGVPESIVVSEWVEGALSAYDAYTKVAWPAELTDFEAHHSGVQVGVGLELDVIGDALVVTKPIPGAPAWTAGVHRGDQLLAVVDERGRVTVEEVGEALATALRGEPDSQVELHVARAGEPLVFSMKRAPVAMQTVFGYQTTEGNEPDLAIEPGIAYLRIAAFRSYTDDRVAELLEGTEPKGVILDLRGNPGGDVQAAANLVDLFVGEGVVASLEGPGAPPPPPEGQAAWNALLPGSPLESVPVAVLIDRDSASAAEIAAGGLAQRDDVVLIGERTYGKGWSQGLVASEDHGFALQVTNSAWKLPDGRMLHRTPGDADWGVVPDVLLVESAAERWQNQARRTRLEFPRTHADGSPIPPPELGNREGLPVLTKDWAIERALQALR